MGLDYNATRFLATADVPLGRTVTLGRQSLAVSSKDLRRLNLPSRPDGYADDALRALGATELLSMDASDFEGAEIVHDLNDGVPADHVAAFDTVIDGGTLEHVFNFPAALCTAMSMVKVGGRLFIINVMNCGCGHGFYQFSPELFYAALSEANGFRVERYYAHEWQKRRWYSVARPADVGMRVEITRGRPTLAMVQAVRVADVPIFEQAPQQSDYLREWEAGDAADPSTRTRRRLPRLLRKLLPRPLRRAFRRLKAWLKDPLRRQRTLRDRRYFSPVR